MALLGSNGNLGPHTYDAVVNTARCDSYAGNALQDAKEMLVALEAGKTKAYIVIGENRATAIYIDIPAETAIPYLLDEVSEREACFQNVRQRWSKFPLDKQD